jgi:DNA-directed RNA polymerase subunit L
MISNIKIKNEEISFEINNEKEEFKISLVNGLRRILISSIYVWNIEEVIFYENNSILDNEFLKKRLSLIPIKCDNNDINYENIIISLDKNNKEEYMENIFLRDFICKEDDKIIDINKLFEYPNILFTKLKNNQSISLQAKLKYNNAAQGGSSYSPVVACSYTFGIDEKKVLNMKKIMTKEEINNFETQDIERVYKKNNIGDPTYYHFSFEINGFFQHIYLIKTAIDILIDKLKNISNEITNKKSEKISILENDENPDFYEFLIKDEDDTIGNILSTYILSNNNVFYSGYLIEHPLTKSILLKIKLKENNILENVINTVVNVIELLVKTLLKLKKEF